MQRNIIDIFAFPFESLLSVLSNREDIIVFGKNFIKLGINLIKTIIIEFYNSEFIQNLLYSFFLKKEIIFYVNIYIFICD
jgi:hypothetical protein